MVLVAVGDEKMLQAFEMKLVPFPVQQIIGPEINANGVADLVTGARTTVFRTCFLGILTDFAMAEKCRNRLCRRTPAN
ncbi:MAG: hypothetical protein BWY31_02925 [Lentisphaerae bacterium ADurb.Bin242]|nr:MAG: hypothetical protein BWY31_02925 [Lentisphaerae bacterium ADurb.Bin242]